MHVKDWFKSRLPRPAWEHLRRGYYRLQGRFTGETSKARRRRVREGFFERYCRGKGIDIGYGYDKLTRKCLGWDIQHGDAQYMRGVPDNSFDFVYSSHTLEHMSDPVAALTNWWRITKPGGYLILFVPDRDLYEKKATLPSRWNPDHRHFFQIERDDPPDTIGLIPLIHRAIAKPVILLAKVCSEGNSIRDPELHSDGEYSIEVVVQKPLEVLH